MSPRLITLLTDFGTQDAYVAQMKGQILSLCPFVQIIDITHLVPPQDILTGALLLAQAVPYFPDNTIHIAVVDPGVGTRRRLLAVEIETQPIAGHAPRRHYLLAPDNGLLARVLQNARILALHQLPTPESPTSEISATFHGRDILAPAAAKLALGESLTQLGPACGDCVPLAWPEPSEALGLWHGQVLASDHFGNVLTNLPARVAQQLPYGPVHLTIANQPSVWQHVRTYGEASVGSQVFLAGSHGLMELAVVSGHAASQLEIPSGTAISVKCS